MVASVSMLTADEHNKVFGYGVFVLGYTINDLYPDGPTEDELHELAVEMLLSETWIDLGGEAHLVALLRGAAAGDPSLLETAVDDLVPNVFVAGGYMLASYRGDGQRWSEYLDEIWAAALAAES
jgi:hypothetical protein